jgi:phage FluMu protein Com
VSDPRKTEEVKCPHCRRVRRVRIEAERPKWKLVCPTCRALDSVEKHHRQVKKLYRFIESRRMRGL